MRYPSLVPLFAAAFCLASPGFATKDKPAPRYDGAQSGTFTCSGSPIPQNGEYVFRNVPIVKMRLDYNEKLWEVRFSPGDEKTQKLIIKNISNGPQKRCIIHWIVVP